MYIKDEIFTNKSVKVKTKSSYTSYKVTTKKEDKNYKDNSSNKDTSNLNKDTLPKKYEQECL